MQDETRRPGPRLGPDYRNKLYSSAEWLLSAGAGAKRRFVTGLLVRCESLELLDNVRNLLQVTSGKDFTYTRSRAKVAAACGSAQDEKVLGREMFNTWEWFKNSSNVTKTHYLLGLLVFCDADLLHMLGNLVRVLIAREKSDLNLLRWTTVFPNSEENSSYVSQSNYSFSSGKDPEQDLLVQARSIFENGTYPHETQDATELDIRDSSKHTMLRGRRLKSSEADDPALMVVPRSSKSMSGISQHRDFIRGLPVGLAKRILGLLDKTTLQSCKHVSQHWQYLTEEIVAEDRVKKMVEDQAVILQGTPFVVNPVYARMREVLVPIRKEEMHIQHKKSFQKNNKVSNILGVIRLSYSTIFICVCACMCVCVFLQDSGGFEIVYAKIKTKVVEMEERNVYCGVYNVLILLDREDPSRVIHYNGGRMVALGSKDRSVRLLDTTLMKQVPPVMHGHAGSVRAVLVCEERELVISASYDLSIRCWNMKTGSCMMLFSGHMGTITCLDLHRNHLVSGSRDCKVKVWSLQTGQCYDRMKFRHRKPIVCVKTDSSLVLSGCEGGLIKMWDIQTATLLKVTQGHQGAVKCLFFDQFHILSGGPDAQVMAWSTDPEFKKCLMTFQHPREVVTLSSLFLRVITGCVDGKIRIFNLLSGDCLRVIKISTDERPIRSLYTHHNIIVVNTSSRVLFLQFAEPQWDYSAPSEQECIPDQTLPRPKESASASSSKSKKNERRSKPQFLSQRLRSLSAPSMQQSHDISDNRYMTQRYVMSQSERAVQERVRKRGPHHPITTTQVLLRVRPSCQVECKDPATSNMELNAAVRDAWGPPPNREPAPPPASKASKRPHSARKPSSFKGMLKIYTPLKTHTLQHSLHSSVPSLTFPKSRRTKTACKVNKMTTPNINTAAQEDTQSPGNTLRRSELKREGRHVEFEIRTKSRPSQSPLDPFRESGGFQLRTDTQMEEYKQTQTQANSYTFSETCRQCRTSWKPKVAPIKAQEPP